MLRNIPARQAVHILGYISMFRGKISILGFYFIHSLSRDCSWRKILNFYRDTEESGIVTQNVCYRILVMKNRLEHLTGWFRIRLCAARNSGSWNIVDSIFQGLELTDFIGRGLHFLNTAVNKFFLFISVINQLDAQNFCFTINLFRTSTCFEHMWSSSGGQNWITQPLVSSHL
jgi:hypothetical protein